MSVSFSCQKLASFYVANVREDRLRWVVANQEKNITSVELRELLFWRRGAV